MPGSQVNKCRVSNKRRVPAVGVAVQHILNIMKGCDQSSMRVLMYQLPAFSMFLSCGDG